jgi:hypothetical protein
VVASRDRPHGIGGEAPLSGSRVERDRITRKMREAADGLHSGLILDANAILQIDLERQIVEGLDGLCPALGRYAHCEGDECDERGWMRGAPHHTAAFDARSFERRGCKTRTVLACGPFSPDSSTNETAVPMVRSLNASLSTLFR